MFNLHWHCCTTWKVSKYGVFSGPYFPVFGLNTEIYSINLRTQSKYRKIRSRKNSVFEQFSPIVALNQRYKKENWIMMTTQKQYVTEHCNKRKWKKTKFSRFTMWISFYLISRRNLYFRDVPLINSYLMFLLSPVGIHQCKDRANQKTKGFHFLSYIT